MRRPLFSLVALASLAVAIGANATIFSRVDAVLLRPLPGDRAQPLMSVFTSESDGNGYGANSYAAFLDLQARRGLFSRVGASSMIPVLLREGDHSQRALGMMVSGSWFPTLGLRAGEGPREVVVNETFARRFWPGRLAGIVLALAAGIGLRGLLHGLSPLDPVAYLGVLAPLGATTLPACWLPARHATAVDPVTALRHE